MSTTVLDIVQQVLSDIDGDEVNGIGDTVEAMKIANIVKHTFNTIVDEYDLQSVKTLFQLEGLGDTAKPTVMKFPDGFHSIEWIKYNIRTATDTVDNWVNVLQLEPADFIDHVTQRNAEGVDMTLANNVTIKIMDNKGPSYWCTFDGSTVVFDSYDNGVDSTLNSSKTNCYGQTRPILTLDDITPIPLPPRFITLLTNEVRRTSFDLEKDGIPISVMQDASRSTTRIQRTRHVDRMNRERHNLPDYGRKRR